MAKRFDGKRIFITGASAGIGAELARELARRGASVAVTARRQERLREVQKQIEDEGGKAVPLVCDVRSRSSIEEAVAKTVEVLGGIDILVANAGFGVNGLFADLETEDYRRQFDTNFFGVLDTVYAALPHLIRWKGQLVIVSSVLGRLALPTTSAYCASKFALCGLAEAIAYELPEKGVSVTCINPGTVESEFRSVDNQGVFHPDKPDPAGWFCVPTRKAARAIANAIAKRKTEAVITRHGKVLVWLNRHFPRTLHALFRMLTRGRLDEIQERQGQSPGRTSKS